MDKQIKKNKSSRIASLLFGILSCFVMSQVFAINPEDPYEKSNRAVFSFNEKVDEYLFKPIATLYVKIMPKPLNRGIHNFLNNINTIPTIANDVLQGNFFQATKDTWRFAINSTFGILGFFDPASHMNLKPYSNDFGLTLAAWGYKDSDYIVLPFFGPYTFRDGFSIPVDYYVLSIYPYMTQATRWGFYALNVVDKRAQLLKFQSVLDEVALDNYSFVRDAYLQKRRAKIEQNQHLSAIEQEKMGCTRTSPVCPITN